MHFFTCRHFYLSLIIILVFPLSALAVPAITCHCFTDRAYDPARPTLADPYFLATTQNSFFAAVFATDKKGLVMKKQQGVSSDDLWIAYWLAGKAGTATPDDLLQARQGRKSWAEVIAATGLAERIKGTSIASLLRSSPSTARLAEAVVDALFGQYKLLSETDLATLRKAGATNQELILATLIAFKSRQPVIRLYFEVKEGSKSWGSLLERAKISPTEIQQEINALLNRSR